MLLNVHSLLNPGKMIILMRACFCFQVRFFPLPVVSTKTVAVSNNRCSLDEDTIWVPLLHCKIGSKYSQNIPLSMPTRVRYRMSFVYLNNDLWSAPVIPTLLAISCYIDLVKITPECYDDNIMILVHISCNLSLHKYQIHIWYMHSTYFEICSHSLCFVQL